MLGPFNEMAYELVGHVGRRIAKLSRDDCEGYFLLQHLSVVVQHFNSICLHDGILVVDHPV